jgi:hypothetical protein
VWVLEPVLLLVFRVLTNSKNKVISSNLSFVIPFNQIHDRTKNNKGFVSDPKLVHINKVRQIYNLTVKIKITVKLTKC